MTKTNTPLDFYFWLGADGYAESVSEEEFVQKQADSIKAYNDWLNCVESESTDAR